ncbi:hypothetical protein [Sphingomonas colocasiae]|nr:hypothetical protein [Sphingomonas colocasiae]
MLKSDLARRFAGGFLVGAIAILAVQPPEGAILAIEALKVAAGLA